MKIKKLCCQFDDTIEVYFLLGINIWGLRSEWVNPFRTKTQKYLFLLKKEGGKCILSSNWQHKFLYFHYKSVKLNVLCSQNKI